MIITRSPLRITLGGGGTDLPSYYEQEGGYVLAAAINKYVYTTVTRPFTEGIFLKYSKLEHVHAVDDVEHPIIREVLRREEDVSRVEITTLTDIPAGTGLGSSGSFTTALILALAAYRHDTLSPEILAQRACEIEIDVLGEPVGKQDQYISAYGGVREFFFNADGSVETRPSQASISTLHTLEDNLLLFFTGFSRRASIVLAEQQEQSLQSDPRMLDNLGAVKALGYATGIAISEGHTALLAEIMDAQWALKKQRSGSMSNPQIDDWYELGRKSGAIGGKLVGAGGGGFLLFYTEEHARLRTAMTRAGLEEVRFRFDWSGTKVVMA